MARGDVRIAVTLACEECKRRNYQTNKSKRNNPDRITLRKYCKWCRLPHRAPRDPLGSIAVARDRQRAKQRRRRQAQPRRRLRPAAPRRDDAARDAGWTMPASTSRARRARRGRAEPTVFPSLGAPACSTDAPASPTRRDSPSRRAAAEEDAEGFEDELEPAPTRSRATWSRRRVDPRSPRRPPSTSAVARRGPGHRLPGPCVDELRRVQWPDRRQVGQGTAVVLGFVVVAGGYLGAAGRDLEAPDRSHPQAIDSEEPCFAGTSSTPTPGTRTRSSRTSSTACVSLGQARAVRQVVVPTETVQEMKDNQKISVEKRTMPGYVLVNMDLNEDSWSLVKGTPGRHRLRRRVQRADPADPVRGRPPAAPRGRGRARRAGPSSRSASPSRSISGPLSDFSGEISEINEDAGKLKVLVSIFGRETPVEVGYDQVKKSIAEDERAQRSQAGLMAKKGPHHHQAAGPGRPGLAGAAGGSRAGPARHQHHGVRQGVQRPDARATWGRRSRS